MGSTEKRSRGRKRVFEDHVMTSMEKKRRFVDKAASIDKDMDEAIQNINWERRNKAEKDLPSFIDTYLMGRLFETQPSEQMKKVMLSLEESINMAKPF